MKTVRVTVLHYYNHPILYSFMPQKLFEQLEESFLKDELTAEIPKKDYDRMMKRYFDTLKN
jgi:hypothetical protein